MTVREVRFIVSLGVSSLRLGDELTREGTVYAAWMTAAFTSLGRLTFTKRSLP